jgi:hypothetical protein
MEPVCCFSHSNPTGAKCQVFPTSDDGKKDRFTTKAWKVEFVRLLPALENHWVLNPICKNRASTKVSDPDSPSSIQRGGSPRIRP